MTSAAGDSPTPLNRKNPPPSPPLPTPTPTRRRPLSTSAAWCRRTSDSGADISPLPPPGLTPRLASAGDGGDLRRRGGSVRAAGGVGGGGDGRPPLRRPDLGGGHDRRRHRLVVAAPVDQPRLPRPPLPPPVPLDHRRRSCSARVRRPPALASPHRAIRVLRLRPGVVLLPRQVGVGGGGR